MYSEQEYSKRLRQQRRFFWYALVTCLAAIGCSVAEIDLVAGLLLLVFFFILAYGLYKSIQFYFYFKGYWHAQGLDDAAIKAKWRELFPTSD